jgi:integrase
MQGEQERRRIDVDRADRQVLVPLGFELRRDAGLPAALADVRPRDDVEQAREQARVTEGLTWPSSTSRPDWMQQARDRAGVGDVLRVPGRATWTGRRDHVLLLLAVQTGLRVSELIGLTRADVHLGPGAHVACRGKGRKDRITPLTSATVTVLRDWLGEHHGAPGAPLFPTRRGTRSAATP